MAFPVTRRIKSVARSARDRRDNRALLAKESVQHTRLPNVRPTDKGNSNRVIVRLVVSEIRGKRIDHLIQEIGDTAPGERGNRVHLAQPKLIKLGRVLFPSGIVGLVDHQEQRRAAPAQKVGKVTVGGCHALLDIAEDQDDIGLFHGNFRLDPDLHQQRILGIHRDTTSVDQRVRAPVPLAVRVQTVTGNAGQILDNGNTVAGKPVEKSGFADVGAANNGDDRFRHQEPPPFS